MMNKLKKSFWAIATTALLFSACQNDDEEVSREVLLLGSWTLDEQVIDKVTVSSGDNQLEFTEEEFIQFLAIKGEDIEAKELRIFSENTTFTFNEDHSYQISDAGNSENILGNWALSEDANQLSLSVSNESLDFTIQSLSSSHMDAGFTFSEIDDGILSQIDFVFRFSK